MKYGLFLLLCIVLHCSATAHTRLGIEVGIAGPLGYAPDFTAISGHIQNQANYLLPCLNITYQRIVRKHLYAGGKAGYCNYSFINSRETLNGLFNLFGNNSFYTDGSRVVCRSSYITLAPLLDIGLGKHQRTHLFLMPGINILINGSLSTSSYERHSGTPLPADYYYTLNTSAHLTKVLIPISYGLTEHIRLSDDWHLTISATISSMLNNIADPKYTGNAAMPSGYASLQLGVMRKYHSK